VGAPAFFVTRASDFAAETRVLVCGQEGFESGDLRVLAQLTASVRPIAVAELSERRARRVRRRLSRQVETLAMTPPTLRSPSRAGKLNCTIPPDRRRRGEAEFAYRY
jgi:hypothetical protein